MPIDGRRLDKATAEPTMLDCLARLRDGKYDGCAEWLLRMIVFKGWGYSEVLQAAIDQFEGVNKLFLDGMQLYYGYGVDENRDEALRMFKEGIALGDPQAYVT